MPVSGDQLIELLDLLARIEFEIWVDGGWAVDVLVGRQTRLHDDLDIAIESRFVERARSLLESVDFRAVARDDMSAWNFVLGHEDGRSVDFHMIVLDSDGNGRYGPPENAEMYPAAALAGRSELGGRSVRCISAG